MVNSEEPIGNTEYLTLYTRRRIRVNRCRHNRVRNYVLEVAGYTELASRLLRDINEEKYLFLIERLLYESYFFREMSQNTVRCLPHVHVNCLSINFIVSPCIFQFSLGC